MMSAWVYLVVGIAAVLGPVITAVVLLRKAGGESRKITVETVDVNVNIAGKLRDKAIEDWERIGRESKSLREEFDQYRKANDERVAGLVRDLNHEQQQRRMSNAYARTLAQVLRDHDMPVPAPPEGLDLN
jgi:hypothetical protein